MIGEAISRTQIRTMKKKILLPESSHFNMKTAQMRRSVSEAFWALCAGDSMSMPVHWYYNIDDIKRDFGGWISGFNSPQDGHPSSIVTLSNTSRRTTVAGLQARPEISSVMPGFVFQPAPVGQNWPSAPTDLMWSVISSSIIS